MAIKVLNPINNLNLTRLPADSAPTLSDLLAYCKVENSPGLQNMTLTITQFITAVLPTLITNITPTGTILTFAGSTAPTGWIFGNGLTIGSASSNATGLASATAANLYALLWSTFSNSILPILTSAGASSTRGASAAADFAANKQLPLLDFRGKTIAGLDAVGGAGTAGLITTAGGNFDGTVIGNSGGAQNETLTAAQIPAHTHNVTAVATATAASAATGANVAIPAAPSSITSDAGTGGGLSHPNVQPTIVLPIIIKL